MTFIHIFRASTILTHSINLPIQQNHLFSSHYSNNFHASTINHIEKNSLIKNVETIANSFHNDVINIAWSSTQYTISIKTFLIRFTRIYLQLTKLSIFFLMHSSNTLTWQCSPKLNISSNKWLQYGLRYSLSVSLSKTKWLSPSVLLTIKLVSKNS